MLSGFTNVFELCQHEGCVTVIGWLSQCSHGSRPRGIKKFCGWQTTVHHLGKGQFVINSRSRGHYGAKAPPSHSVFFAIFIAWRCSQDCYICVDSGLRWKFNLCQLILMWNCDRGNILSRKIWLKLVENLVSSLGIFLLPLTTTKLRNGSNRVGSGK